VPTTRPPRPLQLESPPGPRPAYDGRVSADTVTVAEEEYLQTLFWLMEAGLPMTAVNLSRAMQLSRPTVGEMVRRLEGDGYVTRDKQKTIAFTDSGLEHAREIVSRHRLIERYLTDVVGVPWDEVHEEAESLEHGMSPRFEAYMRRAIGDAKTCPHGHPIEVGTRLEGVPLADVALGAKIHVLRFENEAEDLLHYLKDTGLATELDGIVIATDDEQIVVETTLGRRCTVTASVGATVSVTADPSPPPRVTLPEALVLGRDRYGR
jgi:DtxR family Mn-dependent transcriptional regulator